MDITIQNIEVDESYGEELKPLVPFRSFPVRSENNRYRILDILHYEEHPFWAWVSYKVLEPFKVPPHGESYSSTIDITLHSVQRFSVDYDEIALSFDNGNYTMFKIPIERYSNIAIDAVY